MRSTIESRFQQKTT